MLPKAAIARDGLHPLVVPFAHGKADSILGLLRWPVGGAEEVVVETHKQGASAEPQAALTVRPLGSIAQYARRIAIEADADNDETCVQAASEAAVEAGGAAYKAGEFSASKLRLSQFLLLKAGPFPDVWSSQARYQLDRGDEMAALMAAERGSATNAGWGCALWQQAELMSTLGRNEEQRDLALAALECPFWTLGAPLHAVLAAAQLSHIDDFRGLVRAMEEKVREQQGTPPPSAKEAALQRALDVLDEVVRLQGTWDTARPVVAEAMAEAGLDGYVDV